jgi:integrase
MDMGRITLAEYVLDTWCEAYAPQLLPKTWMNYRQLLNKHIWRRVVRSSFGRSGPRRSRAGRRSGSLRATVASRSATRSRSSERSSSARSRTARSSRTLRERCARRRCRAGLRFVRWRRRRSNGCSACSPRDATLISVLAYAGLRPGEALALPGRDVREQTVLVDRAISLGEEKDTKTAAHRTVRLLEPLAADLREWRLRSGRPSENSLMFPSANGTPWTLAAYQSRRRRAFKRAIEAAGLEHARPYDLRHSFASLLLHEGRSVIYVARQLGHDARLTLRTYGHQLSAIRGHVI